VITFFGLLVEAGAEEVTGAGREHKEKIRKKINRDEQDAHD